MTNTVPGKSPPTLPPFIPTQKQKLKAWLTNIDGKIEVHGLECDIPLANIQALRAKLKKYFWYDDVYHTSVVTLHDASVNFKQHLERGVSALPMSFPFFTTPVLESEQFEPGLLDDIAVMIAKMKISPKYNPAYTGKELDILIPPKMRLEHPYPYFTLTLLQGAGNMIVHIIFKRYGHVAVIIECRINGGPWEQLGINNVSPHVDDRPLRVAGVPEIREYQMRWWHGGEAHGEWSPIQSIAVTV